MRQNYSQICIFTFFCTSMLFGCMQKTQALQPPSPLIMEEAHSVTNRVQTQKKAFDNLSFQKGRAQKQNHQKLLWHAIRSNRSKLLQKLVGKGVDLYQKDTLGDTPLSYAVALGRFEIVKMLLLHDPKKQLKQRTTTHPLENALLGEQKFSIAKALLEKGARLPKDSHTFYLLAMNGDQQAIQLLIASGTPVGSKDINGKTALHYSAMFGKSKLLKYLLKKGADPYRRCQEGYSPFVEALRFGRLKTAKYLLKHYPDLLRFPKQKVNLFFDLLKSPYLEDEVEKLKVVAFILSHGYQVKRAERSRALHLAQKTGWHQIILLIEQNNRNTIAPPLQGR